MSDRDAPGLDAVDGMVRACLPEWHLRTYEPVEKGTDFVAVVDCGTPDGDRTAVLKATTAGLVDPAIARAEPRLLELVGRETGIPVPEVYGFVDEHDEYPAPFYLVEYVDGANVQGRPETLSRSARERVIRETAENLAALHELGVQSRLGRVGVEAGELTILEDGDLGDDFRERFRAGIDETCDALADGTYFPDLAEEPTRFADLAEPLRNALHARADSLSAPEPPRYCHWDYRYGNVLIDPATGETLAVLDWANLTTAEPVYNLAKVESHLFDPVTEPDRASTLRTLFRDTYQRARSGWTLTPAMEERMETYPLKCRTEAMACLPLWLENASPARKADCERDHRAFVAAFL